MLNATNKHLIDSELILANSPDGIFLVTPDYKICYVNPAFCNILGYKAEEILGTSITDYLGDLSILKACDIEIQKHGYCYDQETIFKHKDGSMVNISKNVHTISDDKGNLTQILVTIRDLSKLHKLNSELEDSKRLLEKNNINIEKTLNDLRNTQKQLVESEKLASLGGLVAGVSHEINTPLGISVTSSSSIYRDLTTLHKKFETNTLKRSELESFFEKADQTCKILSTNLQRASNLVHSFKQVAVDQTIDEYRMINLKDYMDEILTSIGPSFKNTGIKVECQCDSRIKLKTHPGAIYQIISNLALNSITHAYKTNTQGLILIKIDLSDDQVMIQFSDNGKGISQENLSHIFTPFYTTRRGEGGTGLGLSIVYNLVTGTLKGKITVDSTENSGTQFNISFPILSQ